MQKAIIPRKKKESDFENPQIDLFTTLLYNLPQERDNLSNTIDFWDTLCRYSISVSDMHTIRTHDGYLPPYETEFKYNGENYKIKITPALIKDIDGVTRAYYPSASEELVEDTLRRLACEANQGFYSQEKAVAGVVFTIFQIREELKKRKKSRSHQEVLKSLDILSKSHIEISLANGKGVTKSNYLSSLSSVSRQDYLTDPNAKWVAHFHPLVAQSIKALTYRQFNFDKMMMQKSQLSRWLHKKLSHTYTNAALDSPYSILFSTIQNESKLLERKRQGDNFKKLEESFEELKENRVITNAIREREKYQKGGGRGRPIIQDILYKIYPHPLFIKEVKAANKRKLLALEKFNNSL